MHPNLIEKLRCYIEFNEDEERFISSVFKLKHFAKGEHFLLAEMSAARRLLSKAESFGFI